MIELRDVQVRYDDRAAPLFDLSLKFTHPLTIVTGPSGSGKSTLLRIISGLQAPTSGAVFIDETPVVRPSWKRAGDERVVTIHQDYRLVDFLTIKENLFLAAELRGIEVGVEKAVAALAQVDLDSVYLDRKPGTLSGGERQRVAIARALMAEAKVLLADEPTGALDLDNTKNVASILQLVSVQSGVQVVVATHDPVVAEISQARWVLSKGALLEA